MKRIIALFGPPGVGKSTLISLARQQGYFAYDLEDEAETYRERTRLIQQLLAKHKEGLLLIGTADTKPEDYPSDTETILLLPPKDIYLYRAEQRDRLHPHKAGQNAPSVYDGFNAWKSSFSKVIADVTAPEQLLSELLSPKLDL